jgi:hypothetical protein
VNEWQFFQVYLEDLSIDVLLSGVKAMLFNQEEKTDA